MIIDSLLVALGFDVDKKGIEEFEAKLERAQERVQNVVMAAGAAAAAVGAFVLKVASDIDDLGDFADRNEVTVASLEELGYAAELNGASIDAVKSSVQGLNSVMGQVINGVGRGAKMFEQFGFKVKNADGTVKSFDQMLLEVSDRMKGMDRKAAMAMAEKLGIDSSLVPMLQKGRAEIEKLRAEAKAFGVTSEENAAAAGAFMDAFGRIRFLARALANVLAFNLMPRITDLIDRFKDWYIANRDVIQQRLHLALEVITFALGKMWDAAYGLVSMVINLAKRMLEFRSGVLLAAAALTLLIGLQVGRFIGDINATIVKLIMNFAGLFTVANLIAVAIGLVGIAIGLLVEDFMVFRRGGESVIGELVKKFPGLAAVIEDIGETVDKVVAWFKAQWATLEGPLMEAAGNFIKLAGVLCDILWPAAKWVFGKIGDVLAFILPIIVKLISWVLELAVSISTFLLQAFNTVAAAITFAADKISGFIQGVKDAIDWVSKLLGLTGSAAGLEVKTSGSGVSVAPLNLADTPMLEMISQSPAMTGKPEAPAGFGPRAPGGPLGTSNNSTVQNTTTNVTTTVAKLEVVSPDPAKAGEAVQAALSRQQKTTIRNGQVGYL